MNGSQYPDALKNFTAAGNPAISKRDISSLTKNWEDFQILYVIAKKQTSEKRQAETDVCGKFSDEEHVCCIGRTDAMKKWGNKTVEDSLVIARYLCGMEQPIEAKTKKRFELTPELREKLKEMEQGSRQVKDE